MPKRKKDSPEEVQHSPLAKRGALVFTLEQLMARFKLGDDPVYLAEQTPHPKDASIQFEEDTHTYYVNYHMDDGKLPDEFLTEGHISASGLIHQYFEEFQPDKAIDLMRRGRNWNSANKYYGLTDEEIKTGWEKNGKRCAAEGTWYHGLLERDMNGVYLDGSQGLRDSAFGHLPPVQQYLHWKETYFTPNLEAFRTELRMRGGIGLRLTGTADLIAIRRNHPPPDQCGGVLELHIIDWKFSKEIKQTNKWANHRSGKGYGVGLCRDLLDTNFSHYCLQQCLYKRLLETYFPNWVWRGRQYSSVKVVSMKLAVFHENHAPHGLILDVEDVGFFIDKIIQERSEAVALKQQVGTPARLEPERNPSLGV